VPTAAASDKHGRAHDRERAASWRDAHEDAAEKADEKKFLTPAQKKRVAIIKGELHAEAQSVHAYIVFAHRLPHEGGAEDEDSEPAAASRMDPFEAAQVAVSRADGSVFMERTLRVDHVGKRGDGDADAGDPKRTVFVGNLDFASKEEDLRVFFEGLVAAERGPPPAADAEDPAEPSGASRRSAWVTRVRIVRDKDTQLGKGFAYVLFMVRPIISRLRCQDAS
jgi:nucleolar protein 12